MRALMVSGVRVGLLWIMSAAPPATTGVAILVPLNCKYCGPGEVAPQLDCPTNTSHSQFSCVGLMMADTGASWLKVEPGESSDVILFPGAMMSGFSTWSSSVGPLEL